MAVCSLYDIELFWHSITPASLCYYCQIELKVHTLFKNMLELFWCQMVFIWWSWCRYHQEPSSQSITLKSQVLPVKNVNLCSFGLVAKLLSSKLGNFCNLLSSHIRFWVSFNPLSSQRLIFRLPNTRFCTRYWFKILDIIIVMPFFGSSDIWLYPGPLVPDMVCYRLKMSLISSIRL